MPAPRRHVTAARGSKGVNATDDAGLLLGWYDRHRRALPWRAGAGEPADPYRVWLSEIMLQQTTVAVVADYYRRFLARWPTVAALAEADLDEVLHAWSGLGYYARARNLHACARVVSAEHGGRFPDDEAALLRLPGVGRYTAAAIAAIAFGATATPVDGNVERVMARRFAVREPLPQAKPRLRALAATLTPASRAGDYAQAVMDLGATVCTVRQPRCLACPWRARCAAAADPALDPADLPVRAPKRPRPLRHGVAFWLQTADRRVLLRQRPKRGLLGGLMEVPGTDWRATPWGPGEAQPPAAADWRDLDVVTHGFTHFELHLRLMAAAVPAPPYDGLWQPVDDLADLALSALTQKVARRALNLERRRRDAGVRDDPLREPAR
jgi:A/G-specific adenine glycosylase